MARGASGRVVIEIDPDLKDELYGVLSKEGVTLRAWFVEQAQRLVRAQQPTLFEDAANRQGSCQEDVA